MLAYDRRPASLERRSEAQLGSPNMSGITAALNDSWTDGTAGERSSALSRVQTEAVSAWRPIITAAD